MVRKTMGRIDFIRWMIGIAVVLAVSCGGRNLQRHEIGAGEPYEDFDPFTLDDDDVSLAEIWGTKAPGAREREVTSKRTDKAPEEEEELADRADTLRATEVGEVEMEEVQGWRVQIFASEGLEAAQRAKEEAMDVFDVPVYMQFEVPYYKVRIGDCRTLSEAEELLRVAKEKGYRTAFRARTLISVEKRSP